MKNFRPLAFFVVFVLLFSLACNALSGGGDTPSQPQQEPPVQVVPTKEPVQEPTKEPAPEPTNPPAPTVAAPPPAPASVEASAFFTEEFDGDLSNWTYWVSSGNENGVELNADNASLDILLSSKNTSVYVFYDPYIYEDVVLEVQADNAGKNNNNVSLVCRYDDTDETWYEFSIANNGLYWIYAYDDGYNLIANGGSNLIKTGRDTNIYTAGCIGDVLSLFINGQEVRTFQDTTYRLKEGQVGLNVTSFDVLPIEVDFEYFTIAEP